MSLFPLALRTGGWNLKLFGEAPYFLRNTRQLGKQSDRVWCSSGLKI